jgi:hypothetical protein
MPVLVPVLVGMGTAAVATTVGASVATAAVVGVGAAVISKKTGVSDKIYEEIFKPVGDLVVDVVKSDLGNAVLKVAAVATGNTWAVPLIDGAKVAANGGSVGDVLKAAAISYVASSVGDVTGKYVSSALADTGASDFLINTVVSGTKSATTAMVYGQDPLKAFAQGGLTAAVSAGLGQVDTKLRETYGESFENLDDKVKQSVFSGLKTELSGGDLTEGQVGDIIAKYTGASNVVNEFLKDNVGLTAEAAGVLTRAVSDGVSVALAGGSGLDAFSGSLSAEGATALKKIIDKPVYKAIDKVTGAYGRAEAAADALTAQSEKAKAAANAVNAQVEKANGAVGSYNTLQAELAGKIQKQDELKTAHDTALAEYNGSKTQANADAVTAAITAYNDYATNLELDYDTNYKDQMASYKATVEAANAEAVRLTVTLDAENDKVTALQETYDGEMDWVVTETDNLDAELKPKLAEVNKAVALTLRPNIDEDAYREMNGLEAGGDVYEHFLQQGQQLPTDFESIQVTMDRARYDSVTNALASAGVDFMSLEPEQMDAALALAGKNLRTFNDIINIDPSTYLKAATDATPRGAALPESFAKATGVTPKDIATGLVSLTNVDGVMTWVKPDRVIYSGGGTYDNIAIKFMGDMETTEPKSLIDMIEEARTDFEGGNEAKGEVVINTVLGLGAEAGKLLDDYLVAPIWAATKALHDHHVEYSPAGSARKNTASIILGAGGEMLQAVAGLSVLAGANPNNALGRTAKDMIALSGDMKSEGWKTAAAEMQANSAAYDEQWRKDNPGQEPSTAMKGFLKAQAIWGNIKDHPVQWISENVVSELLQEVPILLASGGTGNVAKRLLLEAGEAQAKKVAARVAIGTGVTLDATEAFGGTAAGAFDEAYDTALNSGMDEQQATDYAMDVAQKAGTIAVMTLAATAGIGGQALSKSIFGDKGSKTFTDQYNVIKDQVAEGAKVTVKEGVTEFVEEALPQLYIASSLVQIDPTYDVAGSVFEAGIMGKLAGAGTAGGIYTGNALADALMTTNPTVKDAVTNSADAATATRVLTDLGISDNEVLNNLLNTTYDAQYVTTTEAGAMFAKENPGFTVSDAELSEFAGKKDNADLAADVAAYVDPRFLDVEEVKAAAAAEGITLTDEQAEAYVGQKDEASAVSDIKEEYDPQATSRTEAEKFFDDLGYTPTEEEVAARVGATPEADTKTAIGEYVDPRQVTATEVTDAYAELGLERPTDADIQALIGQYMETDLAGKAEENLPTARYNSIINILDNFTGEVGVSEEMQEALDLVKKDMITALGDLGLEVAAIDKAVTEVKDAVDALPVGASPEEVGTAITTALEGLENISTEDVNTAITIALEGMNNLSTEDVSGIVDDAIGTVEETITNLETDLTKLIEDNAGDVDTALTKLATDLGTTEEALLEELDTTKEALSEQFTEGLADVTSNVEGVQDTVTNIEDILGTPDVADDPDTEEDESQDATGLFATIKAYENAGVSRDDALQKAIEDVSGALGTTKTDLLASIGETETSLLGAIGESETSVLDALGETEGRLTTEIADVETNLGVGIQAVADLVGKPARDVTQTDVDFVIDLIAQENVSQELTMQYDVTGDGIVDINDQTMLETSLQGGDVTLADTSMFNPATGLYLQQEQDTQATQDLVTDLNTQINTQIQTGQREDNIKDMMQMLEQSGDAAGQRVDVKTPDYMNIDYIYDFNSIFANPSQAGLFASPFGNATRNQPANQPTGPQQRARGFAEGGQVEDENDILLRLLGDM